LPIKKKICKILENTKIWKRAKRKKYAKSKKQKKKRYNILKKKTKKHGK